MSADESVATGRPPQDWGRWAGAWLAERWLAVGRSVLAGLRAASGPSVLLLALTIADHGVVSGPLDGIRQLSAAVVALALIAVLAHLLSWRYAASTRRQAAQWFAIRIGEEHRTPDLTAGDDHRWAARAVRAVRSALRDPQTWRDRRWLVASPLAAVVLLAPVCALAIGGAGTAVIVAARIVLGQQLHFDSPSWVLQGLVAALIGLALAPYALKAYHRLAWRILDPAARTSRAQLTQRVERLTATRADAVGSQAAELRRIERDLHDGAQARMVAIGMTLGTIEHLMETDTTAARALLSETRQASHRALQELRDLVRGIHPPVLAERGLGDAIRALALDSPLTVDVDVDLPARLDAPVEAAVYFSISELLANAAKHAEAERVWIDVQYRDGMLRATVTDDGHGGADPAHGSGLRGIERRLGTFDGVLALSSPPGGPTIVTLELPCALSSPRTSTSFEKA